MILKVSILVVAVFVQANEVLSQGRPQQYKQPYGYGASMQSFGWDPSAWDASSWDYSKWAPYVEAASKMWMDYFKQAMQSTNQPYNQWDKTRAAGMYNTGMNFAQQMAQDAQNQAEEAMRQAQGAIPKF